MERSEIREQCRGQRPRIAPDHTAPFVGSGRIAVLATPVMINLIEA